MPLPGARAIAATVGIVIARPSERKARLLTSPDATRGANRLLHRVESLLRAREVAAVVGDGVDRASVGEGSDEVLERLGARSRIARDMTCSEVLRDRRELSELVGAHGGIGLVIDARALLKLSLGLVAIGTVRLPVPVCRSGENVSPMPLIAPPPAGSEITASAIPDLLTHAPPRLPASRR